MISARVYGADSAKVDRLWRLDALAPITAFYPLYPPPAR